MRFFLSRGWPFFLFFSVRQVFKSKAGFTYHLTQSKKCSNFGDAAEEETEEAEVEEDENEVVEEQPQSEEKPQMACPHCFKVPTCALNQFCPGSLSVYFFFVFFIRFAVPLS